MSTRSLIMRPIQVEGKTCYQFIYCHSDGYPEGGVGDTLAQHYVDSPEKRDQLFALGFLSVLGKEIGEKHDFEWRGKLWESTGNWSADEGDIRNTWCRAFHRDRGDRFQVGFCDKPEEVVENMWSDFVYIWEGSKWGAYEVRRGKLTAYVTEVEDLFDCPCGAELSKSDNPQQCACLREHA